MDVPVQLVSATMSPADAAAVSLRNLDAADVAVPHWPSAAMQKEAVAARLSAVVADANRRAEFRLALRPWVASIPSAPFPLAPGRHRLRISIAHPAYRSAAIAGVATVELYATPNRPPLAVQVDHGMVHPDAMAELGALHPMLAVAVTSVFNATVAGRSVGASADVRHVHVGGDPQHNLLFRVPVEGGPHVVLGLVFEYIDNGMSADARAVAAAVVGRATTAATAVSRRVVGGALVAP